MRRVSNSLLYFMIAIIVILVLVSGYLLWKTNEAHDRINANLDQIHGISKEIVVVSTYYDDTLDNLVAHIERDYSIWDKEVTRLDKTLQKTSDDLKIVAQKRIILNDSEYELLCRLVEAESGICDFETKRATASVVINRVIAKQYPDNITDVIYQKNQFSVVGNKSIDNITVIDYATMRAVNQAIQKDYIDNALAFYVHDLSSENGQSWFGRKIESGEYVLVAKMDHDVEFYKESGD